MPGGRSDPSDPSRTVERVTPPVGINDAKFSMMKFSGPILERRVHGLNHRGTPNHWAPQRLTTEFDSEDIIVTQ
eukprot:749688-Hanusia_phi.AAC.1